MIKVKLEIPLEIQERMKHIGKDFREGLEKGLRKGMFLAEKAAKESFNSPRHLRVRSGYLRRSITSDVDTAGRTLVGTLGSHVVYAAIHELGGIIRARSSQYLRFQIEGEWKTVRQVMIPDRPYLRPAIVDNLEEISDIIKREILKEVEKE